MSPTTGFQPGLSVLLQRHPGWLRDRRVALVSHAAAIARNGADSLETLRASGLPRAIHVWTPEHGYFGLAGAGQRVRTARHPLYDVPLHSLYGHRRRPTPAMLRAVDVILIDLQDLAVRCYTYASTLRYVLEAAAAADVAVIVADRPVPFPLTVDGPPLDPAAASFVAAIPTPFVYGMTPGELARWLKTALALRLDLRVAPMAGYCREPRRGGDWPPWVPPSPGIATWESAWCYPATVFTEAFPSLDCGRAGRLPFQTLTAPGARALALAERLTAAALPGVAIHPHLAIRPAVPAAPAGTTARPQRAQGIRLTITDPARYLPLRTAITLLHALQPQHSAARWWSAPGNRPAFFDQLFGGPATRAALLAGDPPEAIAHRWAPAHTAFRRTRSAALLYPETAP